jgi:hypothetical protein
MASGIWSVRRPLSDRERGKTFMSEDSSWDCNGGRTWLLLALAPKPDFRFLASADVMETGDLKSGWLEFDQFFLCLPGTLEREGLPTD